MHWLTPGSGVKDSKVCLVVTKQDLKFEQNLLMYSRDIGILALSVRVTHISVGQCHLNKSCSRSYCRISQ